MRNIDDIILKVIGAILVGFAFVSSLDMNLIESFALGCGLVLLIA